MLPGLLAIAAGLPMIAALDSASPDDAWPGDGYTLVWSQEFNDAGRPDDTVWSYEEGMKRNREAQWYQADNARVRDGVLLIEARRERVANPDFEPGSNDWRKQRRYAQITSSSLHTRGKHEWLYGRFEMRARIDTRPGLWPAWWTLGSARGWPGCGEIDIMEFYKGEILANTCWQGEGGRWSQKWDAVRVPIEELAGDRTPEEWSDEFHVWRMDWNENEIRLYLNGELINTTDVNETFNPDGSNPFREPHYMLVNLAVGGNNGGDFSETDFPAKYEIDYIRVYQTKD